MCVVAVLLHCDELVVGGFGVLVWPLVVWCHHQQFRLARALGGIECGPKCTNQPNLIVLISNVQIEQDASIEFQNRVDDITESKANPPNKSPSQIEN